MTNNLSGTHGTHNKVTIGTLLIALGIIYGDIGTSPLYVLKALINDRAISEDLIYGGISLIFWTLVAQTSIKYIYLTLQADNQGEGGIFSLYALVRRYGKNLVYPTILGAAALLADGMITPPISISSAIEGLTSIPLLSHIPTVPIVVAIISLLFFMQRYGTQKVGVFFGPFMVVWFSMIFVLGFLQIIHHPNIILALNPIYGYNLLVNYPQGFWLLGAVFLCTTGAEALYSDLGHCGIKNIRITWIFVKTCLLANYLGQAAWLMNEGGTALNGRNPFFEIMPQWFLIPGIMVATTAAIIASQALISGSYTLINEAINLNFWPRVSVRQPSDSKGQIFIPSINTILWIGCILITLYFQSSEHMEAAYGLAITIAMMMTTYLLGFFLLYKLKVNKILTAFILAFFAMIEIAFFIANIKKFPEGGFVTLIISAIFIAIMWCIYKGRKITNRFTKFTDLDKHTQLITELSQDIAVPKFSTHLIYLTKANYGHQIEEKIVNSILAKKPKRANVYWFLHIHRTEEPFTLAYSVDELVDDTIIKVNLDIGFRIAPKCELYFKKIVQELVAKKELNLHIRPDGSTKYNSEPDFKFIVIEKFLSVENEFAFSEGIILNAYFFMKNLGQSDEAAFGLDRSDVETELIPIGYQNVENLSLVRK